MELDPMEAANDAASNESQEQSDASRLSTWVAITVALLATFLGVCKVKDDNIVQAMQQAQADKLDHWSYYQARKIREDVAKAALVQLTLAADTAPEAEKPKYKKAIADCEDLIAKQSVEIKKLFDDAMQDKKTYDDLNIHDDQFDLSDALVALAISLLALTALTHKKWLYWAAMVPTVFGGVMGMAGLLGLSLHSDFFAKLLS